MRSGQVCHINVSDICPNQHTHTRARKRRKLEAGKEKGLREKSGRKCKTERRRHLRWLWYPKQILLDIIKYWHGIWHKQSTNGKWKTKRHDALTQSWMFQWHFYRHFAQYMTGDYNLTEKPYFVYPIANTQRYCLSSSTSSSSAADLEEWPSTRRTTHFPLLIQRYVFYDILVLVRSIGISCWRRRPPHRRRRCRRRSW